MSTADQCQTDLMVRSRCQFSNVECLLMPWSK